MDVDAGLLILRELIPVFGRLELANANEAETRKKLIDDLLERVLGWDKDTDISYEERVSDTDKTTYADYALRTASIGVIVEAKRIGASFILPNRQKSGKLGGFLSIGEIGAAIEQARQYALSLSLQYCVVTNGSAFIVFPAFRGDSIPWLETHAVIFRDLEDIKERFVEFWSLLSRQRVVEGGLEEKFFPSKKEGSSRRLVSIVSEPGFRLGRNSVYEHIESAITAVFTDEAILSDEEGLLACYIKTSERVKYDSRLRVHLLDAKPRLDRKVKRPLASRSDEGKFDNLLKNSVERPPQFILVLGAVGVGKTTFLHYTKTISSKEIIDKNIPWLYLDFKKATDFDDPKAFIYSQLLECIDADDNFEMNSWEKVIKPAYDTQIKVLQKGVWQPYIKNPDVFEQKVAELIGSERNEVVSYVEKLLKHIGKDRTVFVVIDNVDQILDPETQSRIFLEAQALARRVGCSVIVALREATYLKYRNTPVFDAFQVDAFYIDPPSVLPAVSRRFAYAKQFLSGKKASIRTESGILVEVTDLGGFLDSVSASLLSESSGPMLEVLAAGDVRRALGLVREFLKSAHAETDRVIPRYGAGKSNLSAYTPGDKRFDFPAHEVFKGCVLGPRKFYREEESLLLNVFDSKVGSGALQLLRLRILRFLTAQAESNNLDGVTFEKLTSDMVRLGFDAHLTRSVMQKLIEYKVVMTVDGGTLEDSSNIIITRLGAYLLKELTSDFTYIEFCSLDTSIYDDSIWNDLSDLTYSIDSTNGGDKIHSRVNRVRSFVEYIRNLDTMWCVAAERIGLDDVWKKPFLGEYCEAKLKSNIDRVLRSAKGSERKKQRHARDIRRESRRPGRE